MAGTTRPPLAEALDRVGDRWTLLVVAALLDGPRRFAELTEAVAGIAPNILTQRLRQLEAAGLVVSRPYSERPRRVEYEITAAGRGLEQPIRLLAGWGAEHAGEPVPRHAECGSPLETRLWCPGCERPVDGVEADEEDVRFV